MRVNGRQPWALFWLALSLLATAFLAPKASSAEKDARSPQNDTELRFWLENMVQYHRFTDQEVASATGIAPETVPAELKRLGISREKRPGRNVGAPLTVLPYPGGRHPRIGFLDGAVNPQRETKVSVFTPWDESSYVVVDVPEAIWSNLGLTYLAHTHVPTVWTKQAIDLPKLEWNRRADGTFDLARRLPNGIVFEAKVTPRTNSVWMELKLTNGTDAPLTDLRVQNCVMLKGARGFEHQSNSNKVLSSPYVACRSQDGKRWIITGWEPCHRPWANPPVPCLHSDPKFPDCPAGESRRVHGLLTFYEGTDIDAEFRRLDGTGWRQQ
jgi:hypothetical protein